MKTHTALELKKFLRVGDEVDGKEVIYKGAIGFVYGTYFIHWWDDDNFSYKSKVKPSFDTLIVGDIIVDEKGDEHGKVLEVWENSFLISKKSYVTATGPYSFREAKKYLWKVKGQEDEKCESCGKIIKE